MGNRYEAALQGTGVVTASTTTAMVTLVTASTSRAVIREIGVSLANAPGLAFDILLGFPAAVGVTPSGTVLGQALDQSDTAAVTSLATTWSTKPTAPTVPLRRFTLPNVAGAGVVWVWEPNEMILGVSKNLTVFAVIGGTAETSAPVLNAYFKWSE
jgi:hypothetical protein